MRRDQRNEPFDTPDIADIPDITKMHVEALETMDDDLVWTAAGMKHLLMHNVGRRSGKLHKVVLPYWEDDADERIVCASYGGNHTNPAWYTNISDTAANPEVLIRERSAWFWVKPETLEGDEREAVWEALTKDRPFFNDYAAKAGRVIPVVRLRYLREAAPDEILA
ncbi:MAG: nitroreductase family deazaflavin-dependent oxidoreductase [Acidobacteria bacterium]|nr:nitroreductase family deazaflavin-dependent oxidoreductase [Acidobacteriota bacterium]